MDNQQTIFIGNLAFSTDKNELQDAFGKFGIISEINIPTNRETGQPRGFAFVKFETEDAAKEALSMDGQELNSRSLKVNIAHGKKESFAPRSGAGSTGGSRFGGERRGGMGGGSSTGGSRFGSGSRGGSSDRGGSSRY
ncbi:MAG: RNA-binding protein [Candidatus Dependentiae bacterium]|jgi:RNA recognition motif-containing protein|nr:RNA-binding protein [Candidatus Dependentiae bacterium]